MTQERTIKWKHDFSDLSGKCFRRLREQLSLRFERNQRNPDLAERNENDLFFAMCLDPRTKSLAKKSSHALKLTAFKEKHLEFFNKMRNGGDEDDYHDSGSSSSGSPHQDSDSESDIDESLVVDRRRSSMLTRLESDKIVDNWMNLRIDFDAVAKQQKDEPFDTTKLYKKVTKSGQSTIVYSIDALYHHVDVLQWWKENETKFPTLAIMARIFLSRELTSCFQERVFSIGGFTGNKYRTATLDDRAEKLALGCANKDEHVYLKTIYK